MSAAVSHLAAWQRMLAVPWQQHRNRASMWPLVVLAVALVALPPLLGVLVSPVVARDAAVVCWIIVVIAVWVSIALSLMLQNDPVAARLVPGHVSRLRILLLLSWAFATLAISLAFGLAYGLAAQAIIFVGTGLLLVLVAMRWPGLWLLWWLLSWALPSSVPWWERNEPARVLLLSGVHQVAAQPLLGAIPTLVVGVLVVPWLVQRGGHDHVRAHRRRARWARSLRTPSSFEQYQAQMPGSLWRLIHAPYRFWLSREGSRQRGGILQRALLLLGPGVHWTGYVGMALFVAAPMLLLICVGLSYLEPGQLPDGAMLGMSIGFGMVAIGVLQQAPTALHQTRREQALLMLVPGMPRGHALNLQLARALALQFIGTWLGYAVVLLALASWLRVDPISAIALPLGALPLLGLLWCDWSRQPAPSPALAMRTALFAAAGGLVVFALAHVGMRLLVLGTITLGLTLAIVAWRRRRLRRWPQAWPTGRWA